MTIKRLVLEIDVPDFDAVGENAVLLGQDIVDSANAVARYGARAMGKEVSEIKLMAANWVEQ